MKNLRSEWASYRERAMDARSEEIQVVETRRAFYAGAQTMIHLLETSPEEEAENERYVLALKAELNAFLEEAKAGRA